MNDQIQALAIIFSHTNFTKQKIHILTTEWKINAQHTSQGGPRGRSLPKFRNHQLGYSTLYMWAASRDGSCALES